MLLARIAFITFISLLLVIVGVFYLGHQQPDNPLLRDIQPCGDRICALTLAPDITDYDEALALIRSDSRLTPSAQSLSSAYKIEPPSFRIDVYQDGNNALVTEIDLYFEKGYPITLDLLVAKFGLPCAVIPRYMHYATILIYPDMAVYVVDGPRPQTKKLMLSSVVTQINLLNTGVNDCSQMEYTKDNLPWRGFRKY